MLETPEVNLVTIDNKHYGQKTLRADIYYDTCDFQYRGVHMGSLTKYSNGGYLIMGESLRITPMRRKAFEKVVAWAQQKYGKENVTII